MNVTRMCDLPPKWDGLVVVWDGWTVPPRAFLCPPHKSCCPSCGSLTDPVVNFGRVGVSALVTSADVACDDTARKTLPLGARLRRPLRAVYRLTAFRCPDCHHDTVADLLGDVWVLDESDYGPAGSVALGGERDE